MQYVIRPAGFGYLFLALSVSISFSARSEEATKNDDIFSQLMGVVKDKIEENKADEAARRQKEAQQDEARAQRQKAEAEEKAKADAVQKQAAALQNAAAPAVAARKDENWTESWDKASAAARKANKPILADFTGSDWCGWCKKLDAEVFATKEFRDWAKDNVILLKLDFPRNSPQDPAIKTQNEGLAEKYKITGYPTILFLDDDGKKSGKLDYLDGGLEKFIEAADKMMKKINK
jgi:protein disulfide-isomerase